MRLAVLLASSPLRVEVDPLEGSVSYDPRLTGLSEADSAALEWALRVGAAWSAPVVAVTAGAASAESVLRTALAAGASSAVRVDVAGDPSPAALAACLVAGLRHGGAGRTAPAGGTGPAGATASGADRAGAMAATDGVGAVDLVLAGTWSPVRGSGAVPALVAAQLGAAQALGLLSLATEEPGVLTAERRLDGGRRERLRVRTPAVLSVDAATAPLRRAPLPAVLAARTAPIAVVPAPAGLPAAPPSRSGPLRPRAKVLEPPDQSLPARSRVLALTGGAAPTTTSTGAVALDPPAAAARIIEALTAWGYLPGRDTA